MTVLELSRQQARRIAVRAQLLDAHRPTDLLAVVRHLTLLQLDPTAAVAPSADLVLWARLGSAYSPDDLVAALERRDLVEINATVRPAEDIALRLADMRSWPGAGEVKDWERAFAGWVADNDGFRRDVLARLREEGPLLSRDLPDTAQRPWRSSGWRNNQNVVRMLEFLVERGEVAVAGRRGRQRLWDLAERVYPDLPEVPAEEAALERRRRRLRALGLARETGPDCLLEPTDVGAVGVPAVVEGVPGVWRVDPDQLDRPFEGRAALLSPFDRLVHDRRRMGELFDYEYTLEMYKPEAQRRWGYFALPVLAGDRLVGKLDARSDRKAGVLRVRALHLDVDDLTPGDAEAVEAEIADLARWLGLDLER